VILKITFGNKNDYEYRYMATCLHHFENEGGKNDTFLNNSVYIAGP
jgi:hypothetical protein